MLYYLIKVALSAIMIVSVSEIAKRSTLFGALIASLPLTSLLAIIWMYIEKAETDQIAALSRSIFYLVLPSLAFFILFPFLLQKGLHFYPSLGISIVMTIILYFLLVALLKRFSITM